MARSGEQAVVYAAVGLHAPAAADSSMDLRVGRLRQSGCGRMSRMDSLHLASLCGESDSALEEETLSLHSFQKAGPPDDTFSIRELESKADFRAIATALHAHAGNQGRRTGLGCRPGGSRGATGTSRADGTRGSVGRSPSASDRFHGAAEERPQQC